MSSYVSHTKEISALLSIIKEGKCTTVTTIKQIQQIFIITISQFAALMMLQNKLLFMSDAQAIYTDIFVVIPSSIIMSRFRCNSKMTRKKPRTRLATVRSVSMLLIHCIVHIMHLVVLVICMRYLQHTDVGTKHKVDKLNEISQIGTAVFFVFNFQILYSVLYYTPGAPFRQSKMTNKLLIAFYAMHIVLLFMLLFAVSGMPWSSYSVFVHAARYMDLMKLSSNGMIAIVSLCVSDVFVVHLLSHIISALLKS